MKAIITTSVGFIAAIILFILNETLAREVAVYVAGFGIAIGCIIAFVLFAIALVPGTSELISSVLTEIHAHVPNRKPAMKVVKEKKSKPQVTWVAPSHIDYEAYEMPTYLRRGYNREAL